MQSVRGKESLEKRWRRSSGGEEAEEEEEVAVGESLKNPSLICDRNGDGDGGRQNTARKDVGRGYCLVGHESAHRSHNGWAPL